MSTPRHNFSTEKHTDFFLTLRNRVNLYFSESKISRYANANMVIKSIVMFAIYFVPYIVLLSGVVESPGFILFMWCVMGLGVAGIGLNIMHDANHGVYTKNKFWNTVLSYTMELVGSSAAVWRIQHNVLHHAYTNIQNSDEDINGIPFLLRFSPHQKRYRIHRFQYLYAWFFYGLMTLVRIFYSDFAQLFRFRKEGHFRSSREFRKELFILIFSKAIYFTYILVIPSLVLPVSFGFIFVCFLLMHFIAGFILAVIFQTAHIMPDLEFPLPDQNGKIDNNWAVHELVTTANFAPRSKILSWCVGGLNFQVEHHLFSNVCHVHYSKLSTIVKKTAEEYGLPYHSHKTFLGALINHAKMLKNLGKA
jgi:linoleoyl-CoA desaturase